MHPTLGRFALNMIFIFAFLDIFALFFLRPDEAEFYVAIMGLVVLAAFLAFIIFDIRREAKEGPLRIPAEETLQTV